MTLIPMPMGCFVLLSLTNSTSLELSVLAPRFLASIETERYCDATILVCLSMPPPLARAHFITWMVPEEKFKCPCSAPEWQSNIRSLNLVSWLLPSVETDASLAAEMNVRGVALPSAERAVSSQGVRVAHAYKNWILVCHLKPNRSYASVEAIVEGGYYGPWSGVT